MSSIIHNRLPDRATTPWLTGIPPEVWTMIGQHIHNHKTQEALRRVCRTFMRLFAFLPSEHVTLKFERLIIPTMFNGRIPFSFAHTRYLTVNLFNEAVGEGGYRDDRPNINTSAIARMAHLLLKTVNAMPKLRSFCWWDDSYDYSFRASSLVMQHPRLLQTLKNHPTLERIWVHIASQIMSYQVVGSAQSSCYVPLAGFKNLTCLEIYNFHGPEERFLTDIASCIRSCGKLKVLGLGMSCDYDTDYNDQIAVLRGELGFLERLCLEYSMPSGVTNQTIATPLRLEKLRLGTYLTPYEPKVSPVDENYLAKLFHLEGLRKLHIWNGQYLYVESQIFGLLPEPEGPVEVHWPLFDQCQSLEQLHITRLEEDVTDWINSQADSLEDLVITERFRGGHTKGYQNFYELNLKKLSGLYLSDDHVVAFHGLSGRGELGNSDESVDTGNSEDSEDSDDSDDSSRDSLSSRETENSDNVILGHVDSPDQTEQDTDESESTENSYESETSDALTSDSDAYSKSASDSGHDNKFRKQNRPRLTVLDYLHDKGVHLRKLGISLQFETQWIEFAKRLLEMRHLVQIRIMPRYLGRFPPPTASYWPGISEPKEIALRYARDMHSICPSLQYIQINHYLWQIVPHNSPFCQKDICQIHHDFVEIDADEISEIELFSFYTFAEQSSLLGQDSPGWEEIDINRDRPFLDEEATYQGPTWEFSDMDGDSNNSDIEQFDPTSLDTMSDDSDSDTELQDMLCGAKYSTLYSDQGTQTHN